MTTKTAESEMSGNVSLSERLDVLRKNPAFEILLPSAQTDLAKNLAEETFDPEETVIAEGAEADRLYFIVKGRAEVVTGSADGETALSLLRPGEMFGEIALLTTGAKRTATVRAITSLRTLSLKSSFLTALLELHPEIKASFETSAQILRAAQFLKQASPFASLSSDDIKRLAGKLKKISLPANAHVIRQGEEGDSCYLIREGQVEVVVNDGGEDERALATLEAGSLFGEAALLTSSPRNATVRTISPCEFFELRRGDLIEVMGLDRGVSGRMMEFLSLRGRPLRIEGVMITHRQTPDNTTITILKDPARHAYFQLSPEGWFIWQRLDGKNNLRDIAIDYFAQFKSFAPYAIAETIGRLSGAGFLSGKKPDADVQEILGRTSFLGRMIMIARRIVEYRVMWKDVDKTFDMFYRRGVWVFYTRPAKILMAAVSIAGAVVFASKHLDLPYTLSQTPERPIFFIMLAAAFLFTIFTHELGHAFTTKAFGREVLGIGIGWYWFGPVAFVDTSDMWLAPRGPRVAVTLAGSYTNLILAGLASLIALVVSNPNVQLGMWFFALGSYLVVLVNLNPLLEYDGYYVLMDLLERPNLRARCLSWLGKELPSALLSPKKIRGHALELLYGLGSLLYVAAMASLAMVFYHLVLKKWISGILPGRIASDLAWVPAIIIVAICVLTVIGELKSEDKRFK